MLPTVKGQAASPLDHCTASFVIQAFTEGLLVPPPIKQGWEVHSLHLLYGLDGKISEIPARHTLPRALYYTLSPITRLSLGKYPTFCQNHSQREVTVLRKIQSEANLLPSALLCSCFFFFT